MSVAENIFLGMEATKGNTKFVNRIKMKSKAQMLLDSLGKNVNCKTKVRDLTIAQQQIVEIAKALNKESKILVMDEPTSVLTDEETDILFTIICLLKRREFQ